VPGERKRGNLSPRLPDSWSPEDGRLANMAKQETLQRRVLERRARASGLELRHTAYGYALIDAARKRVHERNDLTLDDVESWLGRS
jgi:hypothetical protein